MERIKVYDTDLTTVAQNATEENNIAFVPVFCNAYTVTDTTKVKFFSKELGKTANDTVLSGAAVNDIFVNSADMKAEKCTAAAVGETDATWVSTNYVEVPLPGDIVYIENEEQFIKYFGNQPYNKATTGSAPDFDFNYIEARELLSNGLKLYCAVMNPTNANDTLAGYKIEDPTAFNVDDTATSGSISFSNAERFKDILAELADMYTYNVKYITTGAYGIDIFNSTEIKVQVGTVEGTIVVVDKFKYPFISATDPDLDSNGKMVLYKYILKLAQYRKDCTYLVDTKDDTDIALSPDVGASHYTKLKAKFTISTTEISPENEAKAKLNRIARNYFPYLDIECPTSAGFRHLWTTGVDKNKTNYILPGSFAFLKALAVKLKADNDVDLLAIAGTTRGKVSGVIRHHLDKKLTVAVAEAYSSRNDIAINCIPYIPGEGFCIWGNQTLVDNAYFAQGGDDGLVASSFGDVMSCVHNICKSVRKHCKTLLFEKDSVLLWTRFLALNTPILDKMVGKYALKSYRIKRVDATERGLVKAKVIVYPVYSVEQFDVNIVVTDSDSSADVE